MTIQTPKTNLLVERAMEEKLTLLGKNLKLGPLKNLYGLHPDAISLAGGLPMDSKFPFTKVSVHALHDEEVTFSVINEESLFMNYTRGDGVMEVREWIFEHMRSLHNPADGITTCMTVGSSDGWAKILELIHTDAIIYDTFAYATAVNVSESMGKLNIGVENDEHGMIPSRLRKTVLKARSQGLTVNIVYLVPVGQNPTGLTMPVRRKIELLDVCRELDLLIVEDDAYYYLYFDLDQPDSESGFGMRNLPQSFLSLDAGGEDSRVIRLDTLAKLMAPGMRMGWVSGPRLFIERYQLW